MDASTINQVAGLVSEGRYDTLSASYAVMAIDAYGTAKKNGIADVTIHALRDGKEQPVSVAGDQLKTAQIPSSATSVAFASKAPGFFYQFATTGYDRTLPRQPVGKELELTRRYVDINGKPVTEIKLGDRIDVLFTLRSGNAKKLPNITVVDLLPGGFEIEPDPKPAATDSPENSADQPQVATEPASDPASGKPAIPAWIPDFKDAREDRMILYGSFLPDLRTFHYRMKATARGHFIVPPAYAESMYDPALRARGVAGSIDVR